MEMKIRHETERVRKLPVIAIVTTC